MKTILAVFLGLSSVTAMSHAIQGTLVLKGSLKTKIVVNGITTVCKVKIDEVKNLMDQDSFGNPAYKLKIDISLSGSDFNSGSSVKYDKEVVLTNLFPAETGTIVKDLEYSNLGITLRLKEDGRLKDIRFPYGSQTITCSF